MQQKYLLEAYDLYGADFHIVKLPLKTEEVRGSDKIKEFSKVRSLFSRLLFSTFSRKWTKTVS